MFLWRRLHGFSPSLAAFKIVLSLIYHSFPIIYLDTTFFVNILHGVYRASWTYGLVFASVLENSLSPAILLKALLSFSVICFQSQQWPQSQGGPFGGPADFSVSLVWTAHLTMAHCLGGSPTAWRPIFCCSVFLVLSQKFDPATWWTIAGSQHLFLVFVIASHFLKVECMAGLPPCKIEFRLRASSQHEPTPNSCVSQ